VAVVSSGDRARERPAAPSRPVAPVSDAVRPGLDAARVVSLQRTVGNAAVSALLHPHAAAGAGTVRPADLEPVGADAAVASGLAGVARTRAAQRAPAPAAPASEPAAPAGSSAGPAAPARRYDFEVAIGGKPMHFQGLTAQETIAKLRGLWRLCHDDLDSGRAENERLVKRREEHWIAGFWSDHFGGVEVPDPDAWNEVGRGTLSQVLGVLDSTDASVKRDWEINEANTDRGLPPEVANLPLMQAALAFDATHERLKRASALLEKAAAELAEQQRRLDAYVEGSNAGARRAITGIKVTISAFEIVGGGAGVKFAQGAGLIVQAAAGAGTAGLLGSTEELGTQIGEMRLGERDEFDFAKIASRATREVVVGFVGGVVGGKFSQVLTARIGRWVSGLSAEALAALGLTGAEFLKTAPRLFVEWVGSTAGTPFATTADALLERALKGRWQVQSFGEFASMVIDQMIENGAINAFLHSTGHLENRSAGARLPALPRGAGAAAEPHVPAGPRSLAEPTPPPRPLAEGSGPASIDNEPTRRWRRPVGEGSGPTPADAEPTGRWERPRPAGDGPISDGVPEAIDTRPAASGGVPQPPEAHAAVSDAVPGAIHDGPTAPRADPEAPVIDESSPPVEVPGPDPIQEEIKLAAPAIARGAGLPPSAAGPLTEEAFAQLARRRGRARPYNLRPPAKSGGSSGGGGRGGTPKRETRVFEPTAPQFSKERVFHPTAADLEHHAGEAFAKLKAETPVPLPRGPWPDFDALNEEVRKIDPAFADDAQRYRDAINDPKIWTEELSRLWQQAAGEKVPRTTAGQLEHVLGGGQPPNEFRNTIPANPDPAKGYEEFRQALLNPRVLVDLTSAPDTHGSHTHAFQQLIGDRLFGPGGGLRFRQRLAQLVGPSVTIGSGPTAHEKPFYSQFWDELFDQYEGMRSPERTGKILQDHGDFPFWTP
jgi:hypothetical protein